MKDASFALVLKFTQMYSNLYTCINGAGVGYAQVKLMAMLMKISRMHQFGWLSSRASQDVQKRTAVMAVIGAPVQCQDTLETMAR